MDSEDIDVIVIYRSKEGSLKELISKLQNLISLSKTTLVIGDMNICNMEKPNNLLNTYLTSKTFKQIVLTATHISGNLLGRLAPPFSLKHGFTVNVKT